jgi:undecaprenyl-diphosphatase
LHPTEAVLLGLVQGLTEFLPVSSSGHLVIFQTVLGVEQEGLLFEIALHIATLISVLVVYRERVVGLVAGALRFDRDALEYGAKLAVATLPAVATVLLVGELLEAQFETPAVAGVCLLVTGGMLWSTRTTLDTAHRSVPSYAVAFWIGCAQAFAILPGISRSGATVAVGMALGVEAVAAAEFSFLMSIVAVFGAGVRAWPSLTAVPVDQMVPLLAASSVAAISGVAAIWLFVRLLRQRSFYRFAYYTWPAGALFLLWLAVR